jgi:hypothetical protein
VQNALWLPKKHTSISALHPPHVLLQASQDSPDHQPYMVSETSNNVPKTPPVTPVPPTKPPPGSHSRTAPNAAVSGADRPDVLLQANREPSDLLTDHDQTLNSFNTSHSTQNKLPTTVVPPTKLMPDSYSHTLAAAPFVPAVHPDVLLQASQDFADHPLQQDLHGTTPPPLPFLLHPSLSVRPSATYGLLLPITCELLLPITYELLLPIGTVHILAMCTVLTMCCTSYVLHSLHTALTLSLTHTPHYALYSRRTAFTMYCIHYVLHAILHSAAMHSLRTALTM